MQDGRPNTQHSLGRSDERVERALRELEKAIKGCPAESDALDALDVLRRAFTSVRAKASTDPLTGLANRAWFNQMLDERLAPGKGICNTAALLFLDLDGFKDVNDQRGHAVGDALLAEVAGRLSHSVREIDLVARHGGDEFVVLLENIENPSIAHAVAARVIEAISTPFSVDGARIQLGVSIGVAFFPEHGRSGEELLKHADYAMYRAKHQGGQSYAVFGEREELVMPRTPNRSWTWELSPLDEAPANDLTPLAAREAKR